VIDSGAACFVGNIQACETAKEYFLEYARSDAPKKKNQKLEKTHHVRMLNL